jgi:hypothetical protein
MDSRKKQKIIHIKADKLTVLETEQQKNKKLNISLTIDDINRCIICGIDMGECNPRQYCGKTYCFYENN